MTPAELEKIVDAILNTDPRIGANISRPEISAHVEGFVSALVSEANQRHWTKE